MNNVLEIGCGIGITSEFIQKHIPNVYSIDISEENINFAKATVKNVHFRCVDFLEFKEKNKFDLITLFDVIEHFSKNTHPEVFEKIKEVSSESTLIAITIPDPDYLEYIRNHHPEKLQVVDESIHFDELISLFEKINLEILKYERYGIDFRNQYRFYLLNYRKEEFILENVKNIHQNKIIKLYKKVVRRVKALFRKLKYKKILKKYNLLH